MSAKQKRAASDIIGIGVVAALAFWVFDTAVDTFVFGEGDFLDNMLAPSYSKLWMRFAVVGMMMGMGLYARHLINERRRTEEALRLSDARSRAMFMDAVDGIVTIDSGGVIESFNSAAEEIFGYEAGEVVGRNVKLLMPEPFRNEHDAYLKDYLTTGEKKIIGTGREVEGVRKDGTVFPLDLAVSEVRLGDSQVFMGIVRDISERKRMEDKLQELATTDMLTGAYNRLKLEEIMVHEVERVKRYDHHLSVIMLDIDSFKEVNDTHGHDVGDAVLRALSDIVREHKRTTDYFVRWGGEEFMVVTPEVDLKGAEEAAERMRQMIEEYGFGKAGRVTVSFGVTLFKEGDTVRSFLKRADDALYRAKDGGRNRVEVME
ncbi:MAG: diguanylate cyclase [Thermodesulfobacteriota bacterium]